MQRIKQLFGMFSNKKEVSCIDVFQANTGAINGVYLLIDVRNPNEWQDTGRPAGSIGISLQDDNFLAKIDELVKAHPKKTLAFSCKAGGRSMQASKILLNAGYDNFVNVNGGYQAWKANGLPTEAVPFVTSS